MLMLLIGYIKRLAIIGLGIEKGDFHGFFVNNAKLSNGVAIS